MKDRNDSLASTIINQSTQSTQVIQSIYKKRSRIVRQSCGNVSTRLSVRHPSPFADQVPHDTCIDERLEDLGRRGVSRFQGAILTIEEPCV